MKRDLVDPISKALAPFIVGMCEYPDQCKITEDPAINELLITIIPHMADFRVICGKGGRQIKAIKFLASVAGGVAGKLVEVALEESFVGDKESPKPFVQNPAFDVEGFESKLNDLLDLLFLEPPRYLLKRDVDLLTVSFRGSEIDMDQSSVLSAVEDLLYPYGFKQGMLLKVSWKHESHTLGASKVLGRQRK